jgi:hypothetical protein
MFAGHLRPLNAVWTKGGFAVATYDELWRFSIGDSVTAQRAQLSRPVGRDAVMGASGTSPLLALGLDDGSVDVFRGITRLRTIDNRGADGGVLQLQFSPNGRALSVTRSNGSWPEKTTIYDVESGTARGKLEGGNVVFDDAGTFLTARGGLYDVASGRQLFSWKEGFYVLGSNGMVPQSQIPRGSEMVAQDYTARGFAKGRAVFAGIGDVVLVDPNTTAARNVVASCGRGKRKLRSHLDAAHGRVIGVCPDAVLVTDLDTGTTERLPGGKFDDSGFPPEVFGAPGTDKLFVGLRETWVLDPTAKTFERAPPTLQRELQMLGLGRACSGRSMPRVDMPCTTGAISDDGQYRLDMPSNGVQLTRIAEQKVEFGVGAGPDNAYALVPRGNAFDVFDVKGPSGARYRLGTGPVAREIPAATKVCGAETPTFHSVVEDAAVYSAYAGAQQTACLCRANGCVAMPFGGGGYFLAAGADGTALSYTVNTTMTESTLRLHRGGRELARSKLLGYCAQGRVTSAGRIFVSCAPRPLEDDLLLELDPKSLAVLARRRPPLGVVTSLSSNDTQLAIVGAPGEHNTVTFVPLDWVVDATKKALVTVYLGDRGAIIDRDGTLEQLADAEDVLAGVRCWNGERMFGVGACRSAIGSMRL